MPRLLALLALPAAALAQSVPPEAEPVPRYEPEAYRGATQLDLTPEYVHEVRAALELLFDRRYDESATRFDQVDRRFPGTGIAAVGQVLSWQVRMLETADARYQVEYREAAGRARSELESALEDPSHQGWDHFLMATVLGAETVHTARVRGYLPALPLALETIAEVDKAKEAAPEFTDLLLLDGVYQYWRTVMAQSSGLPDDFGDHRVQGLAQMEEVEKSGVFLASAATLSLAHALSEEGDLERAEAACARFAGKHPTNILGNMLLGQVQARRRHYDDALATYDKVLRADPSNERVHYWRGVTLLRAGRSAPAIVELGASLASTHLDDEQRADVHYRMGQAHHRLEQYALAADEYEEAVRLADHSAAADALSRMERAREAGRIHY